MSSHIDAKEVEDYSDDDDFEPKVRAGLTSTGSSIGLKTFDRSAHNLKQVEEEEVRGSDVDVVFSLPDGKQSKGKDVGFLKCHLQDTLNIPVSKQVFTAGGRVLIDPLSLRDYDIFLTAKAPVTIEVKLAE